MIDSSAKPAVEPGARPPFRLYRRALVFLLPYKFRFVPLFALSFLSTVVTLAQPYLTKLLIDDALQHKNFASLRIFALLMGVFAILSFGIGILTTYLYTKLSALVLFDMRLTVFRKLQTLSPQFFATTRTGDIVSRINNDIGELQRLSADTLLSLPSNVLFLVGNAIVMAYLNVGMFLVSISMVPVGIWAMTRYQDQLRKRVRKLREQSADIGSFLIESLLGIRLLVSCNAGERKDREFRAHNQRFVDSLLAMQVVSFLAGALPGAVLTASVAVLFLYGGSLVIKGVITIGSLMAFMAYHGRLLNPIQSFMASYSALITGSVSLTRVLELMDQPEEVQDIPHAPGFRTRTGAIEFHNVSFQYKDRAPVLQDVSFRVAPHSICVVVGPSGAGKSTIVDLCLRFYDPASGSVLLNGEDIRQVQLKDVRETVAIVDQNPFFFNSSIRENLLFANPDATKEDLERAADGAGIQVFIESLVDGYETVLGERGLMLSAGQRQRLAVARALLRQPSLLILDEPSAALDPDAEHALAETIQSLRASCTMMVVTHRTALVDIADQVIVLDRGHIVEAGNPNELFTTASALSRHFREPQQSRPALAST